MAAIINPYDIDTSKATNKYRIGGSFVADELGFYLGTEAESRLHEMERGNSSYEHDDGPGWGYIRLLSKGGWLHVIPGREREAWSLVDNAADIMRGRTWENAGYVIAAKSCQKLADEIKADLGTEARMGTRKRQTKDLRMGDKIHVTGEDLIIASGPTFVRGGVEFAVQDEQGNVRNVVLNGRVTWDIEPPTKDSKMATESWLPVAQRVVEGHQAEEVDGVLLDSTTAGVLVGIAGHLNPVNAEKFTSLPLPQAVDMAWKLVERGSIEVGFSSNKVGRTITITDGSGAILKELEKAVTLPQAIAIGEHMTESKEGQRFVVQNGTEREYVAGYKSGFVDGLRELTKQAEPIKCGLCGEPFHEDDEKVNAAEWMDKYLRDDHTDHLVHEHCREDLIDEAESGTLDPAFPY